MRTKATKRAARLPDVCSAAFAAEARRQSRLIAASPGEAEDQAFIDSLNSSIEQGIDAEDGLTRPAEAVFDRLEAKHRVPRRDRSK